MNHTTPSLKARLWDHQGFSQPDGIFPGIHTSDHQRLVLPDGPDFQLSLLLCYRTYADQPLR